MHHSQRSQKGVTLLEIILVLTIASAILLMSIKQYHSFKTDSNVQQVLSNVDQVFQAASYYYQANCQRQVKATTYAAIAGTGKLDPANNPKNPTVVNTYNVLYQTHFLAQMFPANPVVLLNGAATPQNVLKSYIVQYNLVASPTTRTVALSGGGTANVGSVYVWMIQVAVRLNTAATVTEYLDLLRGDCLSHTQGAGIAPCPAVAVPPGAADTYVVFSRLPSTATPSSQSGLQSTNATVKQFTQQYQTYPILYLESTGGASQNYLCGGS